MSAPAAADPVHARLEDLSAQLADLTQAVAAERLERERWREMVHEVTSLARAGMGSLSDTLATAEKRGYFSAARYGVGTLDCWVTTLNDARDAPTPSALALLRQLRDPQVRRGLARALDLLRAMGSRSPDTSPTIASHPAKD